jgi:hypothetical protein
MRKMLIKWAIGTALVGFWFTVGIGADHQLTYKPSVRVMISPTGRTVVAEKRKLEFIDQSGKTITSRKLRGNELINFPPGGGQVIGITRYNDHSPSTLKPVAFDLYDLAGNRLYRIKTPDFSSVVVSPTGNAIVGLEGVEGLSESVLHFYDNQGRNVASSSVEYFQGGRFSADGSIFAFATAKDGILAYTADGTPSAGYGTGSIYDLSADGGVVSVWHEETLRVYAAGKRLTSVKTDNIVRVIDVSASGKYCGWAGPHHAVVYAVGSDTAICEVTPSTRQGNYRSLAIGDDRNCFAVGVDIDEGKNLPSEKRHVRGYAVVYDFSGRLIVQKDVSYERWNARVPLVRFVEGGAALAVITREETHFLQLPAPTPAD